MGGREHVPRVDQRTAANVNALLRILFQNGHLPRVFACSAKQRRPLINNSSLSARVSTKLMSNNALGPEERVLFYYYFES